ncbi:MAG TPA: hypothetical protein VF508_12730 [Pyrinomonadaceae bacterium]
MSDNPTRETPDARSFEERVFARFDNLDGRLTTLEETVDSRLRETRPIWEAMQARLESIEKDVKTVRRSILLLHEDNMSIRGDLRELLERAEKLDGRVEKLESQSTR